jgi:hypothetical protein
MPTAAHQVTRTFCSISCAAAVKRVTTMVMVVVVMHVLHPYSSNGFD